MPDSKQIIARCRELAAFSDMEGGTFRTFLSAAMRECYAQVGAWMRAAQMETSVDSGGNLRGVYAGTNRAAARLLLGSHLDTVKNAGAFDGILGVVLPIALVEDLAGRRLPFDIEVVGFSEEEGVRFGAPFIGSRALIGQLDETLLKRQDKAGVTVAQAIRDFGECVPICPAQAYAAFLEFHIEQGPVLDAAGESIAVVEAIAGQNRAEATFSGQANHAGTTPMHLRRDALAGAAEWMTAVENEALSTRGLMATVGKIQAAPGLSNVIAGEASVSLDLRHGDDSIRLQSLEHLRQKARQMAQRRRLELRWEDSLERASTPMNTDLVSRLGRAVEKCGLKARRMVSGAGHDAMVLAPVIPSAMLFLRSPGGISHHPAETVLAEDVEAAMRVGRTFIEEMASTRA